MPKATKKSDSATKAIVVGVVLALLVGTGPAWWWKLLFPPKVPEMSQLIWDTNYQGSDIANIDRPDVNTAGECSDLCLNNGQCRAMTFVQHPDRPGGICWLKDSVPESSTVSQMASAYKKFK